jgi:hypothetical protein
MSRWYSKNENALGKRSWKMNRRLKMVGPNGLEPSTSSVSRKRSNQTELRAYTRMAESSILTGGGYSGNVGPSAQECGTQG